MPADIACRGCGDVFTAKRSDALWCPACRKANAYGYSRNYDLAHPSNCIDCGKEVVRSAKRCRVCDNKWRSIRYRAEGSPNWKQGRTMDNGYVRIRVIPSGNGAGAYRPEHHLVWERAHGKPVPKGWV